MIFCCAAEAVQTTTMPPTPMTTATQLKKLTTTDNEDLSTTGSYDQLKRCAFPEFYILMVYLTIAIFNMHGSTMSPYACLSESTGSLAYHGACG